MGWVTQGLKCDKEVTHRSSLSCACRTYNSKHFCYPAQVRNLPGICRYLLGGPL